MSAPFKEPFALTPAQEEMVAKLRADGSLIREKAKTLLEHLGLPELHRQLRDPDTSNTHKLDVIKYLSKLGDVDPKAAVPGGGGGERFTINISMPGAPAPGVPMSPPPITIDAVPVPSPPEPEPELPAGPTPLPVPGFKLDMNLVGYAPTIPPKPGA